MKHLITLLITGLLISPASAQPPDSLWSRTFGGSADDRAYAGQQTSDGGYILAGSTRSFGAGNSLIWLVKTDANGDSLWSRTFGGVLDRVAVQQTTDGGYILAEGSYDFWLLKTDADGNSLWSRTISGRGIDKLGALQQTSDGGYVLMGQTAPFGAGDYDFWLVKTDANGDTLWTRTFGGIRDEYGTSVQQTADGGYVLAGWTYSFGSGVPGRSNFWLVKTDADGDSLWSQAYGAVFGESCSSVQQTTDGGYILAGSSHIYDVSQPTDGWVVKTDANGNRQWDRSFGGSGGDGFGAVKQTTDGGYILVGSTGSFGAGNGDMWLVKIDADGYSSWNRTFGGSASDDARSGQQTSDGGYVLVGSTGSFGAGNSDMWLVKTGPEVAVVEEGQAVVRHHALHPVYPNPFNAATTITFDLPESEHVHLCLFDVLGRKVAVLRDVMTEAGSHRVMLVGNSLASGSYFARLEAGEFAQTRRLVLLR